MSMNRHARFSLAFTGVIAGLFFLSLIIHNYLTAMTGQKEEVFYSVFFLLVFVLPISIVYTIVVLIFASAREVMPKENKEKKDKQDITDTSINKNEKDNTPVAEKEITN